MERPGDIIHGASGEPLRVIKVTRVCSPHVVTELDEAGNVVKRTDIGTVRYVALQCEPAYPKKTGTTNAFSH